MAQMDEGDSFVPDEHYFSFPPSQAELNQLSVVALVSLRKKGSTWSDYSFIAFKSHPKILEIEENATSPEDYAIRYNKLYDTDIDSTTSRRMSDALEAHLRQTGRYSRDEQAKVTMYLRKLRRALYDRRVNERRKSELGTEEYYRKKRGGKSRQRHKSVSEMELSANRFINSMMRAGLPLLGYGPKELEEETRQLFLAYENQDKKRAGFDLFEYMELAKMDPAEIKAARLARTDYNKMVYKSRPRNIEKQNEQGKPSSSSSPKSVEANNPFHHDPWGLFSAPYQSDPMAIEETTLHGHLYPDTMADYGHPSTFITGSSSSSLLPRSPHNQRSLHNNFHSTMYPEYSHMHGHVNEPQHGDGSQMHSHHQQSTSNVNQGWHDKHGFTPVSSGSYTPLYHQHDAPIYSPLQDHWMQQEHHHPSHLTSYDTAANHQEMHDEEAAWQELVKIHGEDGHH